MGKDFPFLNEINSRDSGIKLDCELLNAPSSTLVIRLDGFLDNNNSLGFMEAVLKTIQDNKDFRTVIIDMLKVTYISSTGIGALSNIMVQSRKSNLGFYLCNLQKRIKNVMDTLGFTSFFKIVDSLKEITG